MNIQNLLNQFLGTSDTASSAAPSSTDRSQGITSAFDKVSANIPGGLAGGAAAGGIMALLMSNKSARKFAGKAAGYGGAAVLGGLAYNAFKNWQQSTGQIQTQSQCADEKTFISADTLSDAFELRLIKAMIAAAKADGHIDAVEQQNIFNAVQQMALSVEMKAMVLDLLNQSLSIMDLTRDIKSIEQKSELYLASCLVIDPDHKAEKAHLDKLASALALPPGLALHLQSQAQQAMAARQ